MTDAAGRRANAPLRRRLRASGIRVAPFQTAAWQAGVSGQSGLVVAPTGSGKTLAALGASIIEAQAQGDPRGLRLLWITPLRALAADIQRQISAIAVGMGLDWRVLRRTGDSGATERARVARGACEVVVTTPESLSLLLSHASHAERFQLLQCVVVDEWHELLGNKRGVLLQLALARIRALRPALRIWGLSATLGNAGIAMRHLLGVRHDGVLIQSPARRPMHLATALPAITQRFPWGGHLGLSQLPRVLDAVLGARSTLVFTNTRSQAEFWHQALAAVWPDGVDEIAIHHGSLARIERERVEAALAAGSLRCVVATSSLDLGVDFSPVDLVVQIGSPRSVARLLQRAGRSGHQPGARSRLLLVPTHNLEIAECGAVRGALMAARVESRDPPGLSLDVLAQHMVSRACAGGFEAGELLAEVRGTAAFSGLAEQDFARVLRFVTHGGEALASYPQFQRVVADQAGRFVIASAAHARLHRFSIGTIASDTSVRLRFARGGVLGEVEESFAARLKPGDRFRFGGRCLEFLRLRDLDAQVRVSARASTLVPRWYGGRLPLSGTLAKATRALLASPDPSIPEARALAPFLAKQRQVSRVPDMGQLLIEIVRMREGVCWFIHAFAGRLAHEGLAAILGARLARIAPLSLTYAMNDYGIVLSSRGLPEADEPLFRELLAPEYLELSLANGINLAELARRRFRDIAKIAGLLLPSRPGATRAMRQLQASSGLLFDVLSEHDPAHLLLQQGHREVHDDVLEIDRLRGVLQDIARSDILVERPARLTPWSFPLWAEGLRGHLTHEDWEARLRRMSERLDAA